MSMVRKIGVVPFRMDQKTISILFITSMQRRRWIFPKGNLKKKESHKTGFLREAHEEAGVMGKVLKDFPMTFIMPARDHSTGLSPVIYYPMLVENYAQTWPEEQHRNRQWMALEDAIQDIASRDILRVIKHFEKLKPWIVHALDV